MLHTKFRENLPASSGEEDFLRVFTRYGAWRPSWSSDPDAANKEAPHIIWLWR